MKTRLTILYMVLRRFASMVRVGYPHKFDYLRDGLKIVVKPAR